MTLVPYFLPFLASISLLCHVQAAEWASSAPATIPLALRSPYLNLWTETSTADGRILTSTGDIWPSLWNKHGVGWAGLVRVDGKSYRWQGQGGASNTTRTVPGSIRVSPTRTTFNTIAGPVQLTITYLSPIEPSDWVKQSFPFSYVSIDVSSIDGQQHDVQLYSDSTGELLSSNNNDEVVFNTIQTSKSIFHSLQKTLPSLFVETIDQPQDGTMYLAVSSSQPGVTWQTGNCDVTRAAFSVNGTLLNTQDSDTTRKIQGTSPNYWVCLSTAFDLGTISSTSSPAVWALGLVREPSIRAVTASGTETRSLYFRTKYPTIDSAIDDFLDDFAEATKRAQALDIKVMADGSAISQTYADLLAFASRPAFGGMDITVAKTSPTDLNPSDVKVYMKDVGQTRYVSRSNAVDILFSAFPAFLYFDANLAGLLLEPLLTFASSPTYHNNYSPSDLGNTYPDVRGNISETALGLEASGSMLIMALAHARKSGDGTLCQRHYGLLKGWADYLSANALNNQSFVTSDMSVPKGDTNLALKAIIGVQAMSAINKFLEPQGALSSDTLLYSNSAQNLMQGWKNQSWLTDHVSATFGDPSAWSLIYNAYADKLLKTSLIGDDVYKGQAAFYATQTSSAYTYGFQYDSRLAKARSDWTMLTAAAMTDTSVRDFMIESVHRRAVWVNTINVWPTLYYANNASTIGGFSSPGHGATFALLAQNLPDQSIRLDSSLKITPQGVTKVPSNSKRSVAGPVAGGVIGGLAFLCLIALGIIWYRRRRAASQRADQDDEEKTDPVAVPYDPYFGFENISTPTHSTLLASGGPPRSSKSMLTPLRPHTLHQVTNSDPPSSEPLSPGGTTSVSGSFSPPSSQATSALRNEVEELRREMAAMRQNQTMLVDAPPLYSDDPHI